MKPFSRRDVLKTSLLAPVAIAAANAPLGFAAPAQGEGAAVGFAGVMREAQGPGIGAGRERLLLDFGWRFHLGNADDSAKDFGFGSGRIGTFQKTGNFLPAGAIAFDDSAWGNWICRMTGRS